MNRATWRILLTCLLLVALPFKGLAATGMLGCGPNHDAIHDASGQEGGSGRVMLHEHVDGEAHTHAVGAVEAPDHDDALPPFGDATSMEHGSPSHGHLKCGTCAPCCVSAMLTNDVFTPAMPPTGGTEFPAFTIFLRSIPPGRLERPPRPNLA